MTTVTDLVRQVRVAIRRHGLLHGGELVLVAVSGGPDSVALLDVLHELAPELRLRLEVAHVHHGLRAEADADAEFVRAVAERLGHSFHLERVTVHRRAGWEGLEAEARRARLAALEARAERVGADRIATGHTADDQAETVLLRLFDGSGPRGLAGIAPTRDRLVRPLIDSRRAAVLAHLAARGLEWVEDATNLDVRFARNRVRHEVLPALAGAAGPRIVEALCRSAALCRALIRDVERLAHAELGRLGSRTASGFVFTVDDLLALPIEVAAEVVWQAAVSLGDARPRRSGIHRRVRRMLSPAAPRRSVALGPLVMERSGRWLRIGPALLPSVTRRGWPVPGELVLESLGIRLEARRFDRTADYAPPRDRRRVAFDADRLPDRLVVRARRAGERFTPFGSAGERRVKSVLSDEGVARWERARVPILEAAGEVAWVVGVRRGSLGLIGSDTKRILEVTVFAL